MSPFQTKVCFNSKKDMHSGIVCSDNVSLFVATKQMF